MARLLSTLLLSTGLFLVLSRPLQAQHEPVRELRAVWITNVASDVMSSRVKIAEAMDSLKAAGINVVFPVVWNKGFTLYPSPTMEAMFGFPIDPSFGTRDPLKELIAEAHRVGIEVIPWFEFGFSTSFSANGGHILEARPEWAALNNQGNLVVKNGFDWMNGFDPEVQNFMLTLIEEVVTGYDVDGIQGDDRLPAMPVEAGYDEVTKALYRAEFGQDPPASYTTTAWVRWRAAQMTRYAGRIYRRVKALNPNLVVAHAPSPYPFGYNEYLQDWPAWVDSGYVDVIIPQVYRRDFTSSSASSYRQELFRQRAYLPDPADRSKLFPGVLTHLRGDGYLISGDDLLRAIEHNRELGLAGESYFYYEMFPASNWALGQVLHQGPYAEPAVPPYREPGWRPLPIIVQETDAGVLRTGAWTVQTGDDVRASDDAVLTAAGNSGATLTYTVDIPERAYYDYYVYRPYSPGFSADARVRRLDGSGSEVVLNQRAEPDMRGWTYIGT
ncbi:MAG: hypothetical protein D6685_07580, partial [Bacteroidetes bacterium]